MEADPNRERWDFLDKLICQWREVEEKTRDECGLESVPPYPGCRNPTREAAETSLPYVDPYPFIDCDSVENSERICKPSSCCESERSTGSYCQDDVYSFYGDEMVGSICWWCCPGKLLAPAEGEPTVAPVLEPTPIGLPSSSISPVDTIVCSDYRGNPDINVNRICKDGGCCDSQRSSTDHCHFVYNFFGDIMESLCSECCDPSKELAPAPPVHPIYPQIDCSAVKNPFRICKPNSCCDGVGSASGFCKIKYEEYNEIMGSICWYCCSEPMEIDSSVLPPSPPPSPVPMIEGSGMPSFGTPSAPSGAPSQPLTQTEFNCDDYPGLNFNRMCSDRNVGCCNEKRSEKTFCHRTYNLFGDDMENACSQCCDPPKQVAPPPVRHPIYQPTDCTVSANFARICRTCCDPQMSTTQFCQDTYLNFIDTIGSICWYCCSESMEVDPLALVISASLSTTQEPSTAPSNRATSRQLRGVETPRPEGKLHEILEATDVLLPSGKWASELVMDSENFEVTANLQEEYLASIEAYGKRQEESKRQQQSRKMESLTGDSYVNVPYSPYEWMREVRTEYFFRYQGTQMVPPCFETVNYRVMKDPIRIHPDQLVELERLLAWRIAPKGSEFNECERDTAGRERPGSNGDAVDLNRPLQSYHNIHRKVFCECGDWLSKFQEDRDWCDLDQQTRWYEHPYNFDSSGF
jgi:hypothetical protein